MESPHLECRVELSEKGHLAPCYAKAQPRSFLLTSQNSFFSPEILPGERSHDQQFENMAFALKGVAYITGAGSGECTLEMGPRNPEQ